MKNIEFTILNIVVILYCVGILVYTTVNYPTLSSGEGWGVVLMVGLFGIGVAIGILDIVLQLLIKNKKVLNGIGIIILTIAALALLS